MLSDHVALESKILQGNRCDIFNDFTMYIHATYYTRKYMYS